MSSSTERPALFVLSVVHRNALSSALSRADWRVAASRDFHDAAARFAQSGASAALIDLRDESVAGLKAIEAIAPHGRVLAIVPGRDVRSIAAAIDAGATQYLTSPFADAELAQAVRLIGELPRTLAPLAGHGERPVLEGAKAQDSIERRLAKGPVSALLVAATRFESVNAAFGRDVGDELLGSVAQRIATTVREFDPEAPVARLSGAEFAVLVAPGTGVALADEICARINRPFMAGGHIVAIGCRIGVVESAEGEEVVALMRRTSAALADARASDGISVRAMPAEDDATTLLGATLEADLRGALNSDQIETLFQPQIGISSGKVIGVEALARWRHPTQGELGAATLFAVAERSDYLFELSAHVQRHALDAAMRWPESLSGLRVSINVTASDIAHPHFVENFLTMVGHTGFPLSRLTVEVTESGLIDDLATASAVLAALRARGIRIVIDDFGTGYSSLAYLKALPLDYLKIDKQLAQDIAGSMRDRVVVRGVIDMARSLGLAVVAEGVETEEQLALLAAEGCNYYQGFLFAEPLSSAALANRIG